ncbi:MAG: hypothetical protein JST84_13815 [Acidobacteria bacterium]|nr:hypothetical protein [Acidobacteriota bacterium]
MKLIVWLATCLACLLAWGQAVFAQTDDYRVNLEVEGGVFNFTRNDVRDPGDTGTPFKFSALNATGPGGYFRVYAEAKVSERNTLRFLYAPLKVSGTGTLPTPTFFESATFAPNVATKGTYQFNNYRVNWRYTLKDSERWKIQAGAGALIRDAKIELQQGALRVEDPDLGVVPFAAFTAQYNLTKRAHFVFDFEGLGASQGRALDGAVKITYDLTPRWQVGVGYRLLDGGADVQSVYNFAQVHYGMASMGFRF